MAARKGGDDKAKRKTANRKGGGAPVKKRTISRSTPSLHRVQQAIEDTEARVRAVAGKRAEKAKILDALGKVKKRLRVFCRAAPGSAPSAVHYFHSLLDE
jgi:hypothetical protein